jgi:class 3 adenylate cyclase
VGKGPPHWDLVERHHAATQRQISRFRGRVVDTAGDGLLATFDGPPARGFGALLERLERQPRRPGVDEVGRHGRDATQSLSPERSSNSSAFGARFGGA